MIAIDSPRYDAERRVERIRWPDGPVCPYCGEREALAAERDGQIRYECPSCGAHRGHVRRPVPPDPDAVYQAHRRSVLPRFPR